MEEKGKGTITGRRILCCTVQYKGGDTGESSEDWGRVDEGVLTSNTT